MTLNQIARLRELRTWLRRYWRYLRPASRRRELCAALIEQIDGKTGRAAK